MNAPARNIARNTPKAAVYFILLMYLVAVVFPMIWLLYTSLKSDREIFLHPFRLPDFSDLQWSNFTRAWTDGNVQAFFLNSVILSLATLALTVLIASMAAYALARFHFRLASPLSFFFLAGLIVPVQLVVVPLFFQMGAMGLLNSHLGLLLVYVATALPFGIFVLIGFFRTIPSSLYEAAVIDGAGQWRTFWSVMLPLARPGTISVAIFTFLGTWNEYLMAFMFLSGAKTETLGTLPLGLAKLTLDSQHRSDWGAAFAGLVITMLPCLAVYVLLQRHLTQGITLGGVKG